MRHLALHRSWLGLAAVAIFLMSPAAAHALPQITLGTYHLNPQQAMQPINIYAVAGTVTGIDLIVFTGDGGSAVGGTQLAPAIQSVTLTPTNGVFTGNSGGQANTTVTSQYWETTASTSSGAVNLIGSFTDPAGNTDAALVATVMIDTTNFSSGTYPISVSGTVGEGGNAFTADTSFTVSEGPEENALVANGTIIITPEPASLGIFGLALPALLLRRRIR